MTAGDWIQLGTLVITIAGTVYGAVLALREHQRREHRRDNLLAWTDASIEALQSLSVLTDFRPEPLLPRERLVEKVGELAVRVSYLTEQGRLLFRNVPTARKPHDSLSAHSGDRPAILDPLVDAYTIARHWSSATEARRQPLSLQLRKLTKEFVYLAQLEVGRPQAFASPEAGAPGRRTRSIEQLYQDAVKGQSTL